MSREIFDEVVWALSGKLRAGLANVPGSVKPMVQEIRLRANKPVTLVCRERVYFVSMTGKILDCREDGLLIASQGDIDETFRNICNYSVYSHQEEIKNGFITMRGGHRVGICGTAVRNNREITGVKHVSSLNIRIARQLLGISRGIIKQLQGGTLGTLFAGPPCCGKTTLLRDIARVLSSGDLGYSRKVAVVDERSEIAAMYEGVSQNDVGLCDVLDGYPKGEGIMQAIRTLSPQVIVCDEVGGLSDTQAIEESLNAGVVLIASIHAGTLGELIRRKQLIRLLRSGAFEQVIMLTDSAHPGNVENIYKTGELLDKIDGAAAASANRQRDGNICVARAE